MDKTKSILVNLNSMESIKDFANAVTSFDSDVNIYNGNKSYDAKSIMAIFAIDTSVPRYVEIVSDYVDEIENFKEVMSKFQEEKNE